MELIILNFISDKLNMVTPSDFMRSFLFLSFDILDENLFQIIENYI